MTFTRRNFIKQSLAGVALTGLHKFSEADGFYALDDFAKVPKIDIHFHLNIASNTFPEFGKSLNFHLVNVNVAAGRPLKEQFEIAKIMKKRFPGTMDFLGAFSVADFGKPGFAANTISYIKENVQAGALGFKVWKNIGMVLKNDLGKFVMVDDPGFTPIFNYLEQHQIPVMGHLGEPKNCWLPLDQITLASDLRYYTRHPEYHMYKHPEAPSYESLIAATENLLTRHPKLKYVGTHLASLEWSVDEMANHLERHPNMMLDVAARMDHLQYQSVQDKARVAGFLTKYQDRVMYGSDTTIGTDNDATPETKDILHKKWLNDWGYLATDSVIFENMKIGDSQRVVTGLKLPKAVLNKIYRENAQRFFKI
ncbi:amidohydrolase family protein [Dyadobacter sp. 32]|uniref:amidohydrolase family protein n=1 Tax=Dyadobacter sp. 32 TaxID=538966 RepID=UPI0011EC3F44